MDVLTRLAELGALSDDGHFVYTSGKHGPGYVNLDLALPDPALMSGLCRELAEPFRGEVTTVAAPAVGGIVLAVLTAQALSVDGARVRAVWADKTSSGGFAIERAGFAELVHDRPTLVVEDLITTGGSVAKVVAELRRHGARVVGVSAVCNRGGATAAQLGVARLHALATVDLVAYPADACPLCAERVPIVVDAGHGAEFQARYPDHPTGYTTLRPAPAGGPGSTVAAARGAGAGPPGR